MEVNFGWLDVDQKYEVEHCLVLLSVVYPSHTNIMADLSCSGMGTQSLNVICEVNMQH